MVAKKPNSRKSSGEKRRAEKKASRARRRRDKQLDRRIADERRETREWKAFQDLVARIEKTLTPDSTIKSPDHIPDRTTNTPREVDASIRFTVGSVPVLITIECRKRKRKEDVQWIEQLAQKRFDIGATQTIAVSSSGFSQEATEKARVLNLELRRLHDVTDAEIASWCKDLQLVVVEGNFRCEATGLRFANLSKSEKKEIKKAGERVIDGDENTIVAYRCANNEPVSKGAVQQMVMKASRQHPAFLEAKPGEKATIGISYPLDAELYFPIGGKRVPVLAIQLDGTVLESTRTSFPVSRVVEYASGENPLVHVARFDIPAGAKSPAAFVEMHRKM